MHPAEQDLRNRAPRRTYNTLQSELQAGAEGIATTVRGWSAFAPKPAALDEAERAAHGLVRLLGELRHELKR